MSHHLTNKNSQNSTTGHRSGRMFMRAQSITAVLLGSASFCEAVRVGQRLHRVGGYAAHVLYFTAALLLFTVSSVSAQAPLLSGVRYRGTDSNGDPISGAKMCTDIGGTSTPKSTFSDAALSTPNANPVVADSGGLFGPIFLSTGAYKLTLREAGSDGTCATGSVVWTVDNVTGTSIAPTVISKSATYAVTTSDGSDVLVLADATSGGFTVTLYTAVGNAGKRVQVKKIDLTTSAIVVDGAGSELIDDATTVTLSSPNDTVSLESDGTGWHQLVAIAAPAGLVQDGRLTLTSATPVTSGDVSAATSIYFTPYNGGNRISLYDGVSAWTLLTFSEITISISSCTASKPYDVFLYNNSGTVTAEQLVWTDATTRATALTRQNGVYVKTGQTTRRYIGSYYCNASGGQTDDTEAKRYLYNADHRVSRTMKVAEGTDSWNYTTATWRQWNNAAANQLDFLIGLPEDTVWARFTAHSLEAGGNDRFAGIGYDGASAPASGSLVANLTGAIRAQMIAEHRLNAPAVGRHYFTALERGGGAGTVTWYGDNGNNALLQSAIVGEVVQ